ncbi:hypothetical protein GCM10022261_27260 [Brevibacterium daeguense]|uniref:Uncharacterized protein n=1 Tax=Brevibacterium daeguense TaxID=909936 RepID=A0ABP8EMQ0_9MICO
MHPSEAPIRSRSLTRRSEPAHNQMNTLRQDPSSRRAEQTQPGAQALHTAPPPPINECGVIGPLRRQRRGQDGPTPGPGWARA